jgi:hypothetical protein
MEPLAEAVRKVAAEKKTAPADVSAAFHAGGAGPSRRVTRYISDGAHLAEPGHTLCAKAAGDALLDGN